MSSHFDSIAALLNLAANCSIDWPNRPCKSDRHRFQLWSNHNLLRSVASSKYPCATMTNSAPRAPLGRSFPLPPVTDRKLKVVPNQVSVLPEQGAAFDLQSP